MKAEPSHHMEILKEELRWMTLKAAKAHEGFILQKVQSQEAAKAKPVLDQSDKVKPRAWRPGERAVNPVTTEVSWH